MKIDKDVWPNELLVHLSELPIGTVFTTPYNPNWPGYVFIRIWNTDRTMMHLVRLDGPPSIKKPSPGTYTDGPCGQTYQLTPENTKNNGYDGRKYMALIYSDATIRLGEPK